MIKVDEDRIEINLVRTTQALDPEVPGSDLNTVGTARVLPFQFNFCENKPLESGLSTGK